MALTDPQIVQLRTELQADPRVYGYAPLITALDENGLAALLNLARTGSNGGPAITIRRADIRPSDVLEAIDVRDFVAAANQTTLHGSWFESITQYPLVRLLNDDGTDTRVMANLRRVLLNAQGSQTRVTALGQRTGSRAEELWGRDTLVSDLDISKAIRGA